MKTKEELNVLKEEVETVNKKLAELTEDELEQVTGGTGEGTESCPYGKTEADISCLTANAGFRCSHCNRNDKWECDLGYGSFSKVSIVR